MREIKFRAWCKRRNEIISWDYLQTSVYAKRGMGWWNDPDLIPLQYTGLKDENGVEIYSGDILDFYEPEWGGKFDPEVVTMEKIIGEWGLCGSPSDVIQWRSVIGNIYENPELLEEHKW